MARAKGKGVEWDTKKFRAKVVKEMHRRLFKIGTHVESKITKSISKDQPVRRSVTRTGAPGRLVGTTKATPGAPPRVLEGALRQRMTSKVQKGKRGLEVKIGTNTPYAKRLEYEGHPYLRPGLASSSEYVMKTLGRGMKKKKR